MASNNKNGNSSSGPTATTCANGTAALKNILLKVILLGNGGVGMSCIMKRFVSNSFDAHSFHTIGVEFLNKEINVAGQLYTLQIWDTAGQERFKSLRTPFYRGADICILTFAIDDKNSFQNLDTWRDEFLYYADVPDKLNFPFIVVGNKVDVDPEKREVAYETVLDWYHANGNLPYIETSAKDTTNVMDAFNLGVERYVKLDAKLDRPYSGHTVSLIGRGGGEASQNSDNKACCF